MRLFTFAGPALVAVLTFAGVLVPVAGQEATPAPAVPDPRTTLPAQIHAGTCDELGEAVFPLQPLGYGLPVDLQSPAATPAAVSATVVGPDVANAAAVGTSSVSATIDQLVGSPHAIAVLQGSDEETRIACGEIGGFLAGNDLVFGLGEENDSGYAGTGWLHDNGDGTTTVTVFMASGLTRDEETA